MGHLYKGGMWFKTKQSLSFTRDFNSQYGPNSFDLRVSGDQVSNTPKQGKPIQNYFDRYFFLPALGTYTSGSFVNFGSEGAYWTSSCSPDDSNWAYSLVFDSSRIFMDADDSNAGRYVMTFQ